MHVHEFQPWFPFPSAPIQAFVKVIVTVQLRPVFNHAQQIMQKIKSIRKKTSKLVQCRGKGKRLWNQKTNYCMNKKSFIDSSCQSSYFLNSVFILQYQMSLNWWFHTDENESISSIYPGKYHYINSSNHNLLCLTCLHTVQCIIILRCYNDIMRCQVAIGCWGELSLKSRSCENILSINIFKPIL